MVVLMHIDSQGRPTSLGRYDNEDDAKEAAQNRHPKWKIRWEKSKGFIGKDYTYLITPAPTR